MLVPTSQEESVAERRVVNCARCKRDRPLHSRGLCKSCNNWASQNGRLSDYELVHVPGEEWISQINQGDPEACWPWPGPLDTHGYGQLFSQGAHRVLYERWVRPIEPGYELDHACHTLDPSCGGGPCEHRRCVNPAHLEQVTWIENQRRSPYTIAGASYLFTR